MQGILFSKKTIKETKNQSALDRYEQQWQIANIVYDDVEKRMEILYADILRSVQPPKKRKRR